MLVEVILGIFLISIISYLYSQKRPKNFPPGPWGLPILGSLPFLGKTLHQKFIKWRSVYGPIVGLNFGSFPTVVISDYKLIREASSMMEFTGRMHFPTFKDRSEGRLAGILFNEGSEWAEQRKFTFTHLKKFGLEKPSYESQIVSEFKDLISHLNEVGGKEPVNLRTTMSIGLVNNIWALVTAETFEKNDSRLHLLLKFIIDGIQEKNFLAAIGMFIPWVSKCFRKWSGYEKELADRKPLIDFFNSEIEKVRETHVPGVHRALIDIYIDEMRKADNDPTSSFYRHIGNNNLRTILFDLFTAGSETNSTTFQWFCIYMALYPSLQSQLHILIDSQIGPDSEVNYSDRLKIPLLEATIFETLRHSSIVPLGIFRRATTGVKLGNYYIPKDTMVLFNLYSANRSEEYWGDPHEFRPERFLSGDNKIITSHDAFLPFGAGKRECPGKKLSLVQIFLMTSMLLQNFEVRGDENNPLPIEPLVSLVLTPQPHSIYFIPRKTIA